MDKRPQFSAKHKTDLIPKNASCVTGGTHSSKLLLALDVGDRTRAMAQRVVHHVTQVLAPDCTPRFLTDGFREYVTALLTHSGHWMQPSRRQDKGPAPTPRWMPRPELL